MCPPPQPKCKIVVLEGIPCVINTERVDAFNEVMAKYPNIEIRV